MDAVPNPSEVQLVNTVQTHFMSHILLQFLYLFMCFTLLRRYNIVDYALLYKHPLHLKLGHASGLKRS